MLYEVITNSGARQAYSASEPPTTTDRKPSMKIPRLGSLAKACTEVSTPERTVTVAVGHGKKAARHIDAWLRGERHVKPDAHPLASFDKLHVWYFTSYNFV